MADPMQSIYDFADDIQTALNSEHLWVDDFHCQAAARILQDQGYRKEEHRG